MSLFIVYTLKPFEIYGSTIIGTTVNIPYVIMALLWMVKLYTYIHISILYMYIYFKLFQTELHQFSIPKIKTEN